MRQQALLVVAAMSLSISTTAQQTHYFPQLSLARSYDVKNINKLTAYNSQVPREKVKLKPTLSSSTISPRLNFVDLKQQLGTDIRYLRIDQRNRGWQDMFQGLMQGAMDKSKPRL